MAYNKRPTNQQMDLRVRQEVTLNNIYYMNIFQRLNINQLRIYVESISSIRLCFVEKFSTKFGIDILGISFDKLLVHNTSNIHTMHI